MSAIAHLSQARVARHDQTRQAIVKAAVAAFNKQGFHATSIADVARALDVPESTIHHYFDCKEAILFECIARGVSKIRAAAERAQNQGGTGLDRFRALCYQYALCMTEDDCICITKTADTELAGEARQSFRALKRELDETMRAVARHGMADGTIDEDDVRMLVFTASGALNWIARWYDPNGPMTPEQIAQSVVKHLFLGVAPR